MEPQTQSDTEWFARAKEGDLFVLVSSHSSALVKVEEASEKSFMAHDFRFWRLPPWDGLPGGLEIADHTICARPVIVHDMTVVEEWRKADVTIAGVRYSVESIGYVIKISLPVGGFVRFTREFVEARGSRLVGLADEVIAFALGVW